MDSTARLGAASHRGSSAEGSVTGTGSAALAAGRTLGLRMRIRTAAALAGRAPIRLLAVAPSRPGPAAATPSTIETAALFVTSFSFTNLAGQKSCHHFPRRASTRPGLCIAMAMACPSVPVPTSGSLPASDRGGGSVSSAGNDTTAAAEAAVATSAIVPNGDIDIDAVPVEFGRTPPLLPPPLPPLGLPPLSGPKKKVRKSAVGAASGSGGGGLPAAVPPASPDEPAAIAAIAVAAGVAAARDAKRTRSRRRKMPLESGATVGVDAATSGSVPYSYDSVDEDAAGAAIARRLRSVHHGGGAAAITVAAAASRRPDVGGSAVDAAPAVTAVAAAAAAATAGAQSTVQFSSKVPRGPAWSCVRQWVVFSDLHVRESSLATCLEVLRAVEAEARRRQAGLLFLGDFWDRRGALPVEPLNRVLQEMSSWHCPVLMLVGNHDQVDLGGLQHGLTALELACPHVHVFDEPTRWHGALWLPYRRETWVLERAMQQAVVEAASGQGRTGEGEGLAGPLNAIFLHADVRTARTNQWRQGEEGLDPGAFPPHLPVYSGHYHLPHTVPGTNITYVGSPYQVSMNEASETKRLLVLEAPSWILVEEIPLAIGPRHLRLSGPAACDQLKQLAEVAAAAAATAGDAPTGSEDVAEGTSEGGRGPDSLSLSLPPPSPSPSVPAALRPGDRVKLWLSAAEAQDEHVVQAMAELERAGVSVEQVLQPLVRVARVQAAEGLSVDRLVDLYCSCGGGGGGPGSEGLSPEAAAVVRSAVAQARDAAGAGGGGSGGDGPAGRCVELTLESVRLRGFGPFVEEQTYPLASRGVRVIVGDNLDEAGADSNGAGKTSLVTAPLWALTGEVLARTESGVCGRIPVDVMRNDRCGNCVVALTGKLNGAQFEVVREVKRGKTSGLSLRVGDEELTLQDISGTADRIRRLFATELLRCSAFFGQNDITGLLEANDATLKQKLGLVVDLEVWEAARQLLAAPRKAAAAAAAEESGRVRVLAQQRALRAEEVTELVRHEAEWAADRERRLEQRRATLADRQRQVLEAVAELASFRRTVWRLVSELRVAAGAAEEELRQWEVELAAQRAAREASELAATAPGLQPSPYSSPSAAQQPLVLLPSDAIAATTQQQEQRKEQQQEEQEAAQLLRERQADATRLQQLLSARQSAAAQALGRLQQLEASLREYQAAVATAAAAASSSTAVATGAPATTRTTATTTGRGQQSNGQDVPAGAQVTLLQRTLRASSGGGGGGAHSCSVSRRSGGAGHQPFLERSEGVGDDGDFDGGGGGRPEEGAGRVMMAGYTYRPATAILAVCDQCGQPISEQQHAANVDRLLGGITKAKTEYDTAADEEREAQVAYVAARNLAAQANGALVELQTRCMESERRAAAEARAAAAEAARGARAAEAAARVVREAAWRAAEGTLRRLRTRMEASSQILGNLLAAASDLERVVSELDQAAANATAAAAANAATAATAAAAAGGTPPAPIPVLLSYDANGCQYGMGTVGAADAIADRGDGVSFDAEFNEGLGALGAGLGTEVLTERFPEELLAACRSSAATSRAAVLAAGRCVAAMGEAGAALETVQRESNPRGELRARAQRELADLEMQLAQAQAAVAASDARLAALTQADRALGRSGIPSMVLEDVLGQLQAYTARYLNELCDGFVLELSATRPTGGRGGDGSGRGGGGGGGGGGRDKEEINKVIRVRNPDGGSLRQRDVRQLSGGERRRMALALCLGFEELVRRRRRLVCNVMVLDEVLQQLDNMGCERVARVFRDLPHSSVLVVGQTNSSVTANFDHKDVVVKRAGASHVRIEP